MSASAPNFKLRRGLFCSSSDIDPARDLLLTALHACNSPDKEAIGLFIYEVVIRLDEIQGRLDGLLAKEVA